LLTLALLGICGLAQAAPLDADSTANLRQLSQETEEGVDRQADRVTSRRSTRSTHKRTTSGGARVVHGARNGTRSREVAGVTQRQRGVQNGVKGPVNRVSSKAVRTTTRANPAQPVRRTAPAHGGVRSASPSTPTRVVRPSPSTPTRVVRPSPSTPTRVVRPSLSTPTRVVRGRSGRHVGYSSVRIHNARPYHGVFVYGPRPVHHDHYYGASAQETHVVQEKHLPSRDLDREGSLAVGMRWGSFASGYTTGSVYSDPGVGVTVRYRPEEAVGLELAVQTYAQSFEGVTERVQTQTSGSLELFAYPWKRVSPYALVGMSTMSRDLNDTMLDGEDLTTVTRQDTRFGPHVGLGLELAIGDHVALDLEGRYTGYMGYDPTDLTIPGGLSTHVGVLYHF
jgi:opacity protein-like surface antigen